ncbi:Abi family protein [Buchananella felis]|uniref:Abi family protein n=1 Tax=Buchananella felis TaxID=3231492 RepID=UPI0035281A38
MDKQWLSYTEQLRLLTKRGLHIEDPAEAETFLSRVSYYRASGYFRFWQRDPANGDNQFIEGSRFSTIRDLYEAENTLALTCSELLRTVEIVARTRFAHHYSELVSPVGGFSEGKGFTQSVNPNSEPVQEHALRDLDRSKEGFIHHYRNPISPDQATVDPYHTMPIWVAVEAFSFGTLSRLVEASAESGVRDAMAASLNVPKSLLASQLRSFVYLRNRVAHASRLWNHSTLDKPGLIRKLEQKTKKAYGNYSDHSIYKILVALDEFARRATLHSTWLADHIEPLLRSNPLLEAGIKSPCNFGKLSHTILVPDQKYTP